MGDMAVSTVIYSLCAMTTLLCTWLLLQAYGRNRYRLLLWSGLCFAGLAANNLLLVLDKVVLPEVDLSLWRVGVALLAMLVLLYGLIWNAE
jgi:Family of unknown function (DUF5985)